MACACLDTSRRCFATPSQAHAITKSKHNRPDKKENGVRKVAAKPLGDLFRHSPFFSFYYLVFVIS